MVEVFSTNLQTELQTKMLLEQFQKAYPTYHINFDSEDCDNILRVESHNGQIDIDGIRKIVTDFGFSAKVLPDIPVSKSVIRPQSKN